MSALHDKKLKLIEEKASQLRIEAIKMVVEAGSGHSAGPLGMADIFAAFYFHILNHKPKQPQWKERDRLILSNGHICPIQYAALAYAGYFPISELKTLRKLGSRLQGHPHRGSLPGVETTSGPLGSGISQATGMALAAKLDKAKHRVYCLTSDGEHNEGNTWEGIMFAAKYKLNNLTVVVDRNNIQIDGFTENVMPLDSMKDKYEAFNWHVREIDGHNIREVVGAVEEAKAIYEKPSVIIAYTIPGKGVSYMENRYEWHGNPPGKAQPTNNPPKDKQVEIALKDLRTLMGRVESEHE